MVAPTLGEVALRLVDFMVQPVHGLSVGTGHAVLNRAARWRDLLGALSDAAEGLATTRRVRSDGEVKKSGVTWGVPVAPGSQLDASTPGDGAGAKEVGDAGAAGEAAGAEEVRDAGEAAGASSGGASKGSPPSMKPGDALKAFGVTALAMGGFVGVGYLMRRLERRDMQALEQEMREQSLALEQKRHARHQLERFIEETVEAATVRQFGELRDRVEAGERGRDLRARSHEQDRENRATEAERRRDEKAIERDRRAGEAERERDRRAGEAAAQRDRKAVAGETSRAESMVSAWTQRQREFQQQADAQLAEYEAKMKEFQDQLAAQLRPSIPRPPSGATPGGVTDRLRKLYDDD